MNTGKLWRKRCATFWLGVAPYVRYMLSGGLGVTIILLAIVGGFFYARLLETVTVQFPGAVIASVLLFLLMIWCSIRTFLREADIVWLLPLQSEMTPYIRASWIYSFILQLIPPGLGWVVFWPIYKVSENAEPRTFFILLIFIILLKIVNLYGCWQCSHMRDQHVRFRYECIRLFVNALTLYAAFTFVTWKAFVFVLLVLITYMVSLRIPHRLPLHWERLIEMEKSHRSTVYTFVGWFVDVEEAPRMAKRRKYLDFLLRRIPYHRDFAYMYLYLITWVRSELIAIAMRLLLIAGIIIIFSSLLWVKSAAFLIAQIVIGVQLSSLIQYHKHSIWLHLYPLPERGRREAVAQLNRRIHLIFFVVLSIVLLVSAGWNVFVLLTILAGIVMFLTFHWIRRLTH